MTDSIGWRFPPQNGGVEQGFNDSAIDHFKGERISALVRETIQNALDARSSDAEPAVVQFTLDTLSDIADAGFLDLRQYFSAGLEIERLHRHDYNVGFYERAIAQVDDGVVKVLGVHDYNTTGLVGPTENPPGHPAVGAWLALVKGAGITHKASAGALGSFGHGSRAPFAMSELRTVFYFSRIDADDRHEVRFQGKSILQSVPLVDITNEEQWSQSTGYYGAYDAGKCHALLDGAIPAWATSFRREHEGVDPRGTSVYIPEPYDVHDEGEFWAQVRLAVVANFYYAILAKHVVVLLGEDVRIDATTVEDAFDSVMEQLSDLNPNDKVSERLKSALTVRHAESAGERDIDGVGVVKYYLRLNDAQERRVGIARGNGMLITRRPEMLRRFDGPLKQFDLFVCVSSKEGSELLRSLENPAHDAFDFDRIDDKAQRTAARAQYARFAKAVKDLVAELATIEMADEQVLTELDEFFHANNGAEADPEGRERGRGLRISPPRHRRPRSKGAESGADGSGDVGGGTGGGDSRRKGRGGNIPDRGTDSVSLKNAVPVRNLRVVRDSAAAPTATVSFTTPDTRHQRLVLLRSGERNTEPVLLRVDDGEWQSAVAIENSSVNERRHVRIEFKDPEDLVFALEGRLAE
ncbi:hypothetical protein R2Q81_07085 [Microbacterium aquimaris]|uniref:hypothetical protein n=1 Tax=Microbacterium aquimaris TaxID=459816 RepID=UPI002AD3102F|nr:hypothetical protein [Microbacterium aquimaris]MDZ8275713.1 hypothetical protein [Microbacterium aquimaris]